jgi:uncharacterized protein (DUF1697 family)
MPRYIAFLRAINITGRFVKMDTLRRIVATTGVSNVVTYIQSGNVLFDAPATSYSELEALLEQQLYGALGYPVPTFVRSADELRALASYQPFPHVETHSDAMLYTIFLREEPDETAQRALLARATEVDLLQVYGSHVFWFCRRHLGKAAFSNTRIEKLLRTQSTLRQANVVQGLVSQHLAL